MGWNDFLQEQEIRINRTDEPLMGTVPLTGSKSESNRALLLNKLSGGRINVFNPSEADDTRLMAQALEQIRNDQSSSLTSIDVGPAGTVMRFMTAILAISKGNYILTGSDRMKQRPIGLLVQALQDLGARITYTEKSGYPPLAIEGGFEQITDEILIAGDVSSQYLSALLMIAPVLPRGLRLKIKGKLTSRPYLNMTLDMLAQAGITHDWQEDTISIKPQKFQAAALAIEPDWSAASYWYSLLALSQSGELLLPGLRTDSLQGDRAIADIMQHFGISSSFSKEGVLIKKAGGESTGNPLLSAEKSLLDSEKSLPDTEIPLLDFTECPDLAQTVIACAAALKKDISCTGLHTLRIKETDRIAALQQEIAKFGVKLVDHNPIYHLQTDGWFQPEQLTIDTYEDHRMAMAFAPLAHVFDRIHIKNPRVVEKSYPDFWVHLQTMGLQIIDLYKQ